MEGKFEESILRSVCELVLPHLELSLRISPTTLELRPELDASQDKPHPVVFKESLTNLGNMGMILTA